MKKLFLLLIIVGQTIISIAQSVGIGTTTPNSSSTLDMGPSGKPMILPRMNTTQMNAVTNRAQGMLIYNNTEHQLYSYVKTGEVLGGDVNKWQPITTGPRMIAWGIVDSFAVELNGSGNYNVAWDDENRWFTLTTDFVPFYKDSMMLIITAVGNSSWDQAISVGELANSPTDRKATIKFTDMSKVAAGFSVLDRRGRSWFYFTLYDLRKEPY